eukprot:7391617-Prymnesium_polylepis.4
MGQVSGSTGVRQYGPGIGQYGPGIGQYGSAGIGQYGPGIGQWPMAYGAPEGGTRALRGSAVPLARGRCR